MKNKKALAEKIHVAVCQMYEAVSVNPLQNFHFPVGLHAALTVGYPKKLLATLPSLAVESFAGVSYHFKNNTIKRGDVVLDIGSGSGTDVLIASQLVGREGKVIGVDITDAMIAKARKASSNNGFSNVVILKADVESLPIEDESVDVVISNGVINLVPDKEKVFSEIYRVLKPGGKLSLADIVLGNPISKESRNDPKLWAECVVGATLEEGYFRLIERAGFVDVNVIERFDYFSHSSAENTRAVAREYNAHAIVLTAKNLTEQKIQAKGGENKWQKPSME
ncbi:MAG: methyltransferase domain-containing protein [bacterium]|nr:methyltransferase domain-containing protein [bacterium]